MGRSSYEKIEYARKLIRLELPYREIQKDLRNRFGSGMSNTTLQNLAQENEEIQMLRAKNKELEKENKFYKKIYFELLETLKKQTE
ncbi:hypothetical protein [Candidatus Lokiarchaeum ossiferum]|uniref:hypothetical protein n=1 Tax=Candidatus Lokiarchaeum ossiferum TaxID=2951803 RepID=UPI00352F2A64